MSKEVIGQAYSLSDQYSSCICFLLDSLLYTFAGEDHLFFTNGMQGDCVWNHTSDMHNQGRTL